MNGSRTKLKSDLNPTRGQDETDMHLIKRDGAADTAIRQLAEDLAFNNEDLSKLQYSDIFQQTLHPRWVTSEENPVKAIANLLIDGPVIASTLSITASPEDTANQYFFISRYRFRGEHHSSPKRVWQAFWWALDGQDHNCNTRPVYDRDSNKVMEGTLKYLAAILKHQTTEARREQTRRTMNPRIISEPAAKARDEIRGRNTENETPTLE